MRPARDGGHRVERINVQLQQELALALSSEVKDPRLELVTVVAVECAPDLSYARVKISALGEQADRERALKVVRGMSGYLRYVLGERLPHLRRVPRLDVRLDESIPYGVRVSTLLHQLEGEPRAASGGDHER